MCFDKDIIVIIFLFPLLEPSVGPDNVSLAEVNGNTYNISWAPLNRERSYGKELWYEVKQELLSRGKRRKRSPVSSRTVNTTATFALLYEFQICSQASVRAYTEAGPGPYGNPVELPEASFSEYDLKVNSVQMPTKNMKCLTSHSLDHVVKPVC